MRTVLVPARHAMSFPTAEVLTLADIERAAAKLREYDVPDPERYELIVSPASPAYRLWQKHRSARRARIRQQRRRRRGGAR